MADRKYVRDLMKIISMIFAALMFLPAFGSAVPDSVTLGPYNISFDLGVPHSSYQVTTYIRNETEPPCYIVIIYDLKSDQFVQIYTAKYAEKQDALSASSMEKTMKILFPSSNEVSSRIIDGKIGVVAKSQGISDIYYDAVYYPDEYSWTTIKSRYPWNEGTRSLLDTIHINEDFIIPVIHTDNKF